MTGKQLARFWLRLEQTSSRNEMTVILAELFSKASLDEIDKIVYLSLGRLAPLYQTIDFNLAERMMIRALAFSFKTDEAEVKKLFSQMGDIGGVAEKLASKTEAKRNINVGQLFQKLLEIAQQSGTGSQDRKIRLLSDLFSQLDPDTIRYVARIPVGKLRLGFSEMTIIDAISWMEGGNKDLKVELETAFNVNPDIGLLAKTFKQSGLPGIRKIKPVVGTPIKPALTERLPNPEKIVEKLGIFALEPKYDGFRVQIHFDRQAKTDSTNLLFTDGGGISSLFSRRLENTTEMFPEIAQAVKKLPVKSVILDGELIG
ncbi:MAG: DNA ligase, partial [Patescibacteria group bacterium]